MTNSRNIKIKAWQGNVENVKLIDAERKKVKLEVLEDDGQVWFNLNDEKVCDVRITTDYFVGEMVRTYGMTAWLFSQRLHNPDVIIDLAEILNDTIIDYLKEAGRFKKEVLKEFSISKNSQSDSERI